MSKRPLVTQGLREDHALIRRCVAVLRRIAAAVAGGGQFPGDDVVVATRFLREFAEHRHHGKEESLLLATLAAHGAAESAVEVGELLRDHEDTRSLLYTLTLFWEPDHALTSDETAAFGTVTATYCDRIERHMVTEERAFFPLADRLLPGDEQLDLLERFAAIDATKRSAAEWESDIAGLEKRHGIGDRQ